MAGPNYMVNPYEPSKTPTNGTSNGVRRRMLLAMAVICGSITVIAWLVWVALYLVVAEYYEISFAVALTVSGVGVLSFICTVICVWVVKALG